MGKKYCLSVKQEVEITQYNKNGECKCLNCLESECKGVLCSDFPPNNCTNAVDYFKGENSMCVKCRGGR